jgi:hypothetical protein
MRNETGTGRQVQFLETSDPVDNLAPRGNVPSGEETGTTGTGPVS